MKFIKLAVLVLISFASFNAIAQDTNPKNYFKSFPKNANPTKIGKKVTERFLQRPYSNTGSWYTEEEKKTPNLFNNPVGYVVYPDVCAMYGALTYTNVTGKKSLSNQLFKKTNAFLNEDKNLIPIANHVDNNVFGVLPLEVYSQDGNKQLLDLGLFMAKEQFKKLSPEEYSKLNDAEKGWYDKGFSWNTRLWIDDMYMITILQAQAFKATGDISYINQAAKEMVFYLDELQKENGLFHHADNVPIYWGRGNGWMAAGMAELLEYLPADNIYRNRIMDGYKKMMATLLKYQDNNGMWHQIVDDKNAWAETSCTGMFTFAFITGVKKGWLDETEYGPAARRGWVALCSYINDKGDISEICIGTNKKNDYQFYLNRPRVTGDLHGQAPILWCATALLK